jgi:hypothetical protein
MLQRALEQRLALDLRLEVNDVDVIDQRDAEREVRRG